MIVPRGTVTALLDELSATGQQQRWLRATTVVAPVIAWLFSVAAGATNDIGPLALVVLAAAWCALRPDSHVGLLVPLVLAWHWLATVERTTSVWVLGAAWAVLAFHASATAAAAVPATVDLGRLLLPWCRHVVAVTAVTAGVWGVAAVLGDQARSGSWVLTTAALTVLSAAAAVGAVTLRRASG